MGKLILETQTSIDGFIADKQGGTNWMIWNWGPDWTWDKDLQRYHTNLNISAKSFIISSQMAQEGFNQHWGKVTIDPTDRRFDFANHIHNSPKYVASTTLTKNFEIPGGWNNTHILGGDLRSTISTLKDSIDGNIIVYGGARLVSNLIDADVIDEYHLITNPVALGSGLSIFRSMKSLKMVNAIPFTCGVVVTQYTRL